VPWIELGGKIEITCAKTGYHATVDFLTKVRPETYNFSTKLSRKMLAGMPGMFIAELYA